MWCCWAPGGVFRPSLGSVSASFTLCSGERSCLFFSLNTSAAPSNFTTSAGYSQEEKSGLLSWQQHLSWTTWYGYTDASLQHLPKRRHRSIKVSKTCAPHLLLFLSWGGLMLESPTRTASFQQQCCVSTASGYREDRTRAPCGLVVNHCRTFCTY